MKAKVMSEIKPTMGTKNKHTCLLLNPPKRIPLRRTLVVLGVERGGTSMAAGVLRALGISMGARAGLNHEDPGFLRDDPEQLKKAIRTRNQMNPAWGFKVPKASLQLPFYEENLRNPFYVVVYRNSLSVVDSWQQRGAGDALNVLDRIATYQSAILQHMRTSKAPVLLINYERAVADDTSIGQMVEEMAQFAGIELTEELRERAMSMVTGDGAGYVNLPEHYFLVEPAKLDGTRPAIPLKSLEPEQADSDGWVSNDKTRPQTIYALESGKRLPRKFWLEVDFDSENLDLNEQPVRFFFNFLDAYFPGHCARPKIAKGRNMYWVETSGNAKDIGFGVIKFPARTHISLRAFEASDADTPVEKDGAIAASSTLAAQPGLISKVAKKLLNNG